MHDLIRDVISWKLRCWQN